VLSARVLPRCRYLRNHTAIRQWEQVLLRPLFARVLLQRDDLKPSSALLIPDQYKKRNAPSRGIVIAKGPAASGEIEIGKVYLFGQHAGAWVNEHGIAAPDEKTAQFYICQDEDLLCGVEP